MNSKKSHRKGAKNPHITLAQYEAVKTHAPQCEFVVYAGCQHNITDTAPQRCAEQLLRFLRPHGGRQ